MAFDERLVARIRQVLAARPDVLERRMFGGIAFMVGGNMAVGIVGEDLMVRVGPDGHEEALGRPHVRPMDFTGRPMQGYVYVAPAGIVADDDLRRWVEQGAAFAATLPPK